MVTILTPALSISIVAGGAARSSQPVARSAVRAAGKAVGDERRTGGDDRIMPVSVESE